MTIPLSQQLALAREILATMRERKSAKAPTMEAIVATLQRQVLLEEVSNEMAGRKTEEVGI